MNSLDRRTTDGLLVALRRRSDRPALEWASPPLRRLPDLLADAAAELHRCPIDGFGSELTHQTRRPDICDSLERSVGAVGLAFLEVVADGGHGVGDVRDAEHVTVAGGGVGVERCGFHLDRDHTGGLCAADRSGGLAVGGIGGPGRADDQR